VECPDEQLTSKPEIQTTMDLKLQFEHGFMRAFMTSAFTLWTRLVGDLLLNIISSNTI